MNTENNDKMSSFERVNYFYGKVLTTEDFKAEQTYFQEKHRLINRCILGWGIICGLNVSFHHEAVRIQPGFALDCQGNEIIVPEAVDLRLPETETSQYIVIQYTEKLCRFVPAPDPVGTGDHDITQPTRILETYMINYRTDNPCKNHNRSGSICRLCKSPHAIPIAKIIFKRARWSVKRYPFWRHRWWVRLLLFLIVRKNR